jgi:hypothetical protein
MTPSSVAQPAGPSSARPTRGGFLDVLHAAGPAVELGDAADVYGWLIGSWIARVVDYGPDGVGHESTGEWHFAWVLAGRAVQDVFIVPPRQARRDAARASERVRYGTTLRVCDPATGAWRIVWFNPASGAETHLVGRREGRAVVQEGRLDDGTAIRWSFVDVAADSFTWRGEVSPDGGRTWNVDAEFFCRRAPSGSATHAGGGPDEERTSDAAS